MINQNQYKKKSGKILQDQPISIKINQYKPR